MVDRSSVQTVIRSGACGALSLLLGLTIVAVDQRLHLQHGLLAMLLVALDPDRTRPQGVIADAATALSRRNALARAAVGGSPRWRRRRHQPGR